MKLCMKGTLMLRSLKKVVVIIAVLLISVQAFCKIELPVFISDYAVFQRGVEIPLWGTADASEEITIEFDGKVTKTTAGPDGKWEVKLPQMKAGGPYCMTIKGSATEKDLFLSNLLIGEVWICSGQSNMAMLTRDTTMGRSGIKFPTLPDVRCFQVSHRLASVPRENIVGYWAMANWQNTPHLPGVPYFFARELHEQLGVPVGIFCTSWGGAKIEPWIPKHAFYEYPELKPIADRIDKAEKDYRQEVASVLDSWQKWVDETKVALKNDQLIKREPAEPIHPLTIPAPGGNPVEPIGAYNAMVHPLTKHAIKGVIWYQGEGNVTDGMLYAEKQKALVDSWRKAWGQGDFPFYYVQLAPFKYQTDTIYRLAEFWEAQTEFMKEVKNTGMIVTTDITDDLADIHPQNKHDVGKRLANWALAKDYGKDVAYCGPIYRSMKVEGDKIRVYFDHADNGLATSLGDPPVWFEIAGDDMNFVQAVSQIDGSTVIAYHDSIPNPVAIRFAWSQEATPILINKEGLPASAFRSYK